MTDNYLWRLSGLDLRNHAFRTHRDFPTPIYVTVPALGRVECRGTACRVTVPVAFVLPHDHFTERCCRQCLRLLGIEALHPGVPFFADDTGVLAV